MRTRNKTGESGREKLIANALTIVSKTPSLITFPLLAGRRSSCSHSSKHGSTMWRGEDERDETDQKRESTWKFSWSCSSSLYTIFNVPVMNSLCWDSHRTISVPPPLTMAFVSGNKKMKYHGKQWQTKIGTRRVNVTFWRVSIFEHFSLMGLCQAIWAQSVCCSSKWSNARNKRESRTKETLFQRETHCPSSVSRGWKDLALRINSSPKVLSGIATRRGRMKNSSGDGDKRRMEPNLGTKWEDTGRRNTLFPSYSRCWHWKRRNEGGRGIVFCVQVFLPLYFHAIHHSLFRSFRDYITMSKHSSSGDYGSGTSARWWGASVCSNTLSSPFFLFSMCVHPLVEFDQTLVEKERNVEKNCKERQHSWDWELSNRWRVNNWDERGRERGREGGVGGRRNGMELNRVSPDPIQSSRMLNEKESPEQIQFQVQDSLASYFIFTHFLKSVPFPASSVVDMFQTQSRIQIHLFDTSTPFRRVIFQFNFNPEPSYSSDHLFLSFCNSSLFLVWSSSQSNISVSSLFIPNLFFLPSYMYSVTKSSSYISFRFSWRISSILPGSWANNSSAREMYLKFRVSILFTRVEF